MSSLEQLASNEAFLTDRAKGLFTNGLFISSRLGEVVSDIRVPGDWLSAVVEVQEIDLHASSKLTIISKEISFNWLRNPGAIVDNYLRRVPHEPWRMPGVDGLVLKSYRGERLPKGSLYQVHELVNKAGELSVFIRFPDEKVIKYLDRVDTSALPDVKRNLPIDTYQEPQTGPDLTTHTNSYRQQAEALLEASTTIMLTQPHIT